MPLAVRAPWRRLLLLLLRALRGMEGRGTVRAVGLGLAAWVPQEALRLERAGQGRGGVRAGARVRAGGRARLACERALGAVFAVISAVSGALADR